MGPWVTGSIIHLAAEIVTYDRLRTRGGGPGVSGGGTVAVGGTVQQDSSSCTDESQV